jgi:hypothetical protein
MDKEINVSDGDFRKPTRKMARDYLILYWCFQEFD